MHLKALTSLQTLNLSDTQVTDAGLAYLQGLTRLKRLALGPKITDAGLAHVRGLTQLGGLNLYGPRITDAGLVHLKGLTQLEYVDLQGTKVTEAGVEDLQRALPKVKIYH